MRLALCALVFAAACATAVAKPKSPPPAGDPPGKSEPAKGEPCPDKPCAAGLTCVKYYGIAGARGPQMQSCERRCGAGGSCPTGEECITIADGPGQVCRPKGSN